MRPADIYGQEHESNRPSGTQICVKLTHRNNKCPTRQLPGQENVSSWPTQIST
jgi:hypothetical protein